MCHVWQLRDHLPADLVHKLVFNLVQWSQTGELLVAVFSHLSFRFTGISQVTVISTSVLWRWLSTSSLGYFRAGLYPVTQALFSALCTSTKFFPVD